MATEARVPGAAAALWLALVPLAWGDAVAEAAAHWRGCTTCHGDDGGGSVARHAPAIAGQPAAYIERQLLAFREGRRGGSAADLPGRQMSLMAEPLADPAVRKAIAVQIAAMPVPAGVTPAAGHAASAGRKTYAMCVACHGEHGEGGGQADVPRLAGLDATYVLRQLRNYGNDRRGYAVDDTAARQMADIADTLSYDDARAVADYVASLAAAR